jgi:hypothetical protein
MLYNANQIGPYKIGSRHDPDSITQFAIVFRPGTWAAGTVYNFISSDDYDMVLPTTFKGYYHAAINSGKSHAATEPVWKLRPGEVTNDFEAGATDGLQWQAVAYNLLPVAVDVASVTLTPTNGVTISGASNTTTRSLFTIDAIAADALARTKNSFQIKARVVLSTGESRDFTLEFKLSEH